MNADKELTRLVMDAAGLPHSEKQEPEFEKVKTSSFGNTYGGLSLVRQIKTGDRFLEMEDCFGPEYHGPLTEEQVAAFLLLCEL